MSLNPIIALWSQPRSLSTTLERVMRARGDLACFHEPFMYYYYEHLGSKQMPFFNADTSQPRSYREVWSMLQKQAQTSPVFFKDMSYYIYPKISSDSPLKDQLVNTFLIRNPLKSIPSYHKLDPDVTLAEIGLEAQWKHYRYLLTESDAAPCVIEAESIQSNPAKAMAAYCTAVGLEFKPHSLQWDNASSPKAWESVEGWHQQVTSSTGVNTMEPQSQAEMEQQFEAYVRTADAPHLYDYLQHHQEFYEQLKAAAR